MIIQNNYFKVLRGGTHSTFQDSGFNNKQHLGITNSGVVDNELFLISNKILNNNLETPVLEFCFQGPSLKLMRGCARIVISGNVSFNILTSKKIIEGIPFQSYLLKFGDIIDILSTIKSNYAYLSVEGGFKVSNKFGSSSTLTIAQIGANDGKKIKDNQYLFINKNGSNINSKIIYNKKDLTKYIRVIPGPQMHYFFPKMIKKFFGNTFVINNNSNRMGIRLDGNSCKAIKSHNISSEGIVKGSIQVPEDGNPIVLMNDHPTIGGYPKIAIVVMADLSKIAQLPIGSKFKFIKISLEEAEKIYKIMIIDLHKQLKTII